MGAKQIMACFECSYSCQSMEPGKIPQHNLAPAMELITMCITYSQSERNFSSVSTHLEGEFR